MNLEENLNKILSKYDELQKKVTSDEVINSPKDYAIISKEISEILPTVDLIKKFKKIKQEIKDSNLIIEDTKSDNEMKEMAKIELENLIGTEKELEKKIQLAVLPKDKDDSKNAVLEIRAGTGGDEAGLFAADLFRMYQKYCDFKSWKFEILSVSESLSGSYKEAMAVVSGDNVFSKLKFESGVHRVQRVPDTEASGRIHTSAATVAVLPEVEDIEVKIDEKDLRIDVFRASGPGGQSVNTTDSAVRITHIPTNIVVQQQDEKSQHKNKAKALKILRARIYDFEQSRLKKSQSEERKNQVGSGDRSERIRTYNFPQGRVTDHRINLTLHKLEQVLSGESLDEIIDKLLAEDKANKLANLN
jgi:peptide chain release factor 1